MILWAGGVAGPTIVPGAYQVRLTASGKSQTQRFEVRKDPRLATTLADYQKRFDLHMKIRDKLSETHEAILEIRDVRDQLKAVAERSATVAPKDTAIAAAAKSLSKRLTAVEEALYQTKNKSSQDPLSYPIRLNNKLSHLTGVVASADAPPTNQTYEVYEEVAGKIDVELAKLKALLGDELATFNRMVRDKEIPAVVVKEKKKEGGAAAPARAVIPTTRTTDDLNAGHPAPTGRRSTPHEARAAIRSAPSTRRRPWP